MANERRLIDAERLKRRIIAFATGLHADYLAIENIVMMINQEDTLDFVCCKECRHMTIEQGLRYCNAWERFNGAGDEGYCNYGEKREVE